MKLTNQFENIRKWAKEKAIIEASTSTQMLKVVEEVGELSKEILYKTNNNNIKLEIGDCLHALIVLAQMEGLNAEDCLNEAYYKNTKRASTTKNGVLTHKS